MSNTLGNPKFGFPLLLVLVTGLAGNAGAADPVPYRTDAYPLTLSASAGLSHTISVSDARWLRVHFQSYDIVDSEITIAASAGGESQTLHGFDISTWNEASAFFDGNSLLLTLVLAPGEAGASVTIDELSVGVPRIEPAPSLCGNDDRVAVAGGRVARLMPAGCTAWPISNGAFLTAGHCVDADPDQNGPLLPDGIIDTGGLQMVEFNVPASDANGTTNASSPQDQFPVDLVDADANGIPDTMFFNYDGEGTGLGKDWAVFRVNNNTTTGENPHVGRGFFRTTRTDPTAGVSQMRITGYGVDSTPAGSGGGRNADNQTNQTSTGTYTSETTTNSNQIRLRYEVDTTGGNSGSPIIRVSDGLTYGIHTNAGCGAIFGSNSGTSFEVNDLENAINAFTGLLPEHVDPGHSPINQPVAANGSMMEPWDTIAGAVSGALPGGIISIVTGNYGEGPIVINKNVKLVAPVGAVTIE